jgi:AraC-like DNA-binding protein
LLAYQKETALPPTVAKHGFDNVKAAIGYIRQSYDRKISLDELAKITYSDKYALCRNFKRLTGQTVVQYINLYRCQKAAEMITNGQTVAEAAHLCGFDNLSFFTKTFKHYMGALPSFYKT